MRIVSGFLAISLLVACGGSDDDTGSGTGGTGGQSAGGTSSGGAGGSGGVATGGSAGTATGGAAGTPSGGAAGSSSLCSATTNPYDPNSIDCSVACDNYGAYDSNGPCANPYDDHATCVLACDTIKGNLPYVNAQYGCAAENAECSGYLSCMNEKCG